MYEWAEILIADRDNVSIPCRVNNLNNTKIELTCSSKRIINEETHSTGFWVAISVEFFFLSTTQLSCQTIFLPVAATYWRYRQQQRIPWEYAESCLFAAFTTHSIVKSDKYSHTQKPDEKNKNIQTYD